MSAKSKLWFSIYDRAAYKGEEKSFYEADQFSWTKKIAGNYKVIQAELDEYLKKQNLITYFNSTMVEKESTWKTISMKWWGLEVYRHQKWFKETTKLINEIPGIVSASFNLLEAGSTIKAHHGDTNGIYRCHLGLAVPEGDCGFRVEDEKRKWKDGDWLIFVDALNHEAWNKTNQKRLIMVIDVVRPEFIDHKKYICTTVLTGLFLQKMAERFKLLYKLSAKNQRRLAKTIRPLSYPALFGRNLASKAGIVD
jgi:ornithine lipid ester-linked acyl 2-hydroxylase